MGKALAVAAMLVGSANLAFAQSTAGDKASERHKTIKELDAGLDKYNKNETKIKAESKLWDARPKKESAYSLDCASRCALQGKICDEVTLTCR